MPSFLPYERHEPSGRGPLTAHCLLLTLFIGLILAPSGVSTDPLRFSPRRYGRSSPRDSVDQTELFLKAQTAKPGSPAWYFPRSETTDRFQRTAGSSSPGTRSEVDQCGDAVRSAAKGPRRLPLAWGWGRPATSPQLPRSRPHVGRISGGWTPVRPHGARQHRSGSDNLCLEHAEPRRDRAMARGFEGSGPILAVTTATRPGLASGYRRATTTSPATSVPWSGATRTASASGVAAERLSSPTASGSSSDFDMNSLWAAGGLCAQHQIRDSGSAASEHAGPEGVCRQQQRHVGSSSTAPGVTRSFASTGVSVPTNSALGWTCCWGPRPGTVPASMKRCGRAGGRRVAHADSPVGSEGVQSLSVDSMGSECQRGMGTQQMVHRIRGGWVSEARPRPAQPMGRGPSEDSPPVRR